MDFVNFLKFLFLLIFFIRLDWLEKHEPSTIPEGYTFSIAYSCLLDCTQSIYAAIETDNYKSYQSQNNVDKDGFFYLFKK